jgi:hypothetical protein
MFDWLVQVETTERTVVSYQPISNGCGAVLGDGTILKAQDFQSNVMLRRRQCLRQSHGDIVDTLEVRQIKSYYVRGGWERAFDQGNDTSRRQCGPIQIQPHGSYYQWMILYSASIVYPSIVSLLHPRCIYFYL